VDDSVHAWDGSGAFRLIVVSFPSSPFACVRIVSSLAFSPWLVFHTSHTHTHTHTHTHSRTHAHTHTHAHKHKHPLTRPRLPSLSPLSRVQDVCVQLMRKFFTGIATGKPLLIKSVVANPAPRSVKGRSYVYIEAFKLAHVQEAIKGIENLRYGQWKQDMVAIEDRPNVLRVVKPSRPLKLGDWVQLLRSGDYKGDVARVEDVQESEGKVVVQVPPLPPPPPPRTHTHIHTANTCH
jgi:hypothetical protein